MAHDFSGKVALVTGGGSGIGCAAASAFAQAGASVVAVDLDGDAAKVVAEEIGGLGLQCDVTVEAEVAAMLDQVTAKFGRLDIAFNNAGIGGRKGMPTADLPFDDWQRIIAVNLSSVFLCMKHELAIMASWGSGVIVNTSSTAGLTAAVNSGAAYAASKHGVIGLTKTAAKEYLNHGIRINAICPGGVATPLLEATIGKAQMEAAPKGLISSPEEIAETVLWLCSPAAASCNGQAIVLDGGRVL